MKRRQFLAVSVGAASGAAISKQAQALALPCPPPAINVSGGTSAQSSCIAAVLPAWASALSDKTWASIATSATISAVTPSTSPGGNTGFAGIIDAWGGAALDTSRQELIVPAQGGHNDYWGNEVYALGLNAASPAWLRVTTPRYAFGSNNWDMDDGSPRSNHGASTICYAQNVDRTYVAPMLNCAPYGNSYTVVHAFSRASNSWTKKSTLPANWASESSYGGCAYDSATGSVWICGVDGTANSVSRYNPVSDSHTVYTNTPASRGYSGTLALSVSRRCMIYINGSVVNHNGTFVWFDLDNPTAGWRSPASVTGSSMTGYGPGLVWHPASGKFIGWNGSGVRSALLTLTPPANLVTGVWAWNSVPAAASNGTTPSAQAQNGTYGRFNLVQDLAGSGRDFLVLLNGVAQATFAYKLPASGL